MMLQNCVMLVSGFARISFENFVRGVDLTCFSGGGGVQYFTKDLSVSPQGDGPRFEPGTYLMAGGQAKN
jgi:hypothetical protein